MHQFNRRVSVPYGNGTFALLYYRDAQLFIKRLRKYIDKYFHEKIRYYIIGEYGTSSLRPHWHLLLFFDSSALAREFEIVDQVGTINRPAECAHFYVRCGTMVLLTLNGQTSKPITMFLRMLISLLLFLPFLTSFLSKRVITPINLVRFYRKKYLSNLSENVTLMDLETISLPMLMALKALLPYGGRITMNSSHDLVGNVFALLKKHSQYCQATKD